MLPNKTKQYIRTKLNESHFALDLYKITFGNEEDSVVFEIVFQPKPNMSFLVEKFYPKFKSIEDFDTEQIRYKMLTSPGGGFEIQSNSNHESLSECIFGIATWCENVYEEMKASGGETDSPAAAELDKLRKKLKSHIEKNSDNLDGFFSKEEGDFWKEKLTILEERITKQEISVQSVKKKFAADILQLKEDVYLLNKKIWFHNLIFKLTDLLAKQFSGFSIEEMRHKAIELLEFNPTKK